MHSHLVSFLETEMVSWCWVTTLAIDAMGPLLLTWVKFNASMGKSKNMPNTVWYEITYPFLNYNGRTVDV